MKLFSEVYVKKYLPLLRKAISHKLVNELGYTQLEASKLLHIDQTTISQYFSPLSKPLDNSILTPQLELEINKAAKKLIFSEKNKQLEIFKDLREFIKKYLLENSSDKIYFDI